MSLPTSTELEDRAMRPDDSERQEIERELGDRYQIVRTLGRGAFGAVHLARERQLHRLVAVKVLHADRAWSDEERERLLREARTLGQLSHPAIIPLLAFGETATTVYMVMPYVEGESLASRLAAAGRLDPREARRILLEVADALAYAHGEGVLHRDLKPENILLERAGALDDEVPPRVRLIDFGVAAFPARDPGVLASSETWGTPHFMAPEQAFGEPALDPRSELYSFGVLGYLLLGGQLPFAATSPTARLTQQRKGPIVPLAVAAPDAPDDLVQIVQRCLAFEPEKRPRRAREVRDILLRGTSPEDAPTLAAVRRRLGVARSAPSRPRAPRARQPRPWSRRVAETLSETRSDARFALRMLRKTPGFTAAVLLTLAIGLSATTVVFSAVDALVLREPPVADPGTLVVLDERQESARFSDFGASVFRYDRYLAYREAATDVLSGLAGQQYRPFSVRLGDQAIPVSGLVTSKNYFEVLGIRPALGRFYAGPEDEPGGAEAVTVIGYDFWQRTLGGDPGAVGRTLVLDSRPLTIVGVAPRGFSGAVAGIFAFDVWVPAAAYQRIPPAALDSGRAEDGSLFPAIDYARVNVFGRLAPGVTLEQANAALGVIAQRIPAENPRRRTMDAWASPLRGLPEELQSLVDRFMAMLLAVAGLVLLIAAANAAGMLLARAAAREREVATRLAVGATRGRLVRQMFVESAILCLGAGVLGLLLTWWPTRLLDAWRPPLPIPLALDFGVNTAVLAVAALAMLGTALLAGLLPAFQATRIDLAPAMKEGGLRTSPRRARLRRSFVVAQIALSLVLLAVAGLFVRSLQRTVAIDAGFEAEGVAHARVALAPHGYDDERARALFARLTERVRTRPEVVAAAFASNAPLTGSTSTSDARRPDVEDGETVNVQWSAADVGFVELLRIPLLAGRAFTTADGPGAPPVTVINETLARRFWPGESPQQVLGHELRRNGRNLTVVGVVANGKYSLLQETDREFGFIPFQQEFGDDAMLFVRGRGTAAEALRAAREELAALDPNVAFARPSLLTADVSRYLVPQRVAAFLIGTFGLVGLVLAMTGLYGVLAFVVAQRLREFGVRIALGARSGDVVRLVLRDGLLVVAIGAAIGLVGALAAGRLVAGFLFGLDPADPVTLVAVPLILAVVAVLACIVPARRAATADPMVSLRAE